MLDLLSTLHHDAVFGEHASSFIDQSRYDFCRCLCGSGGSLKAAALLTLAGHRCKPMIPHLDSQRATAGKPG